MSKSFRTTRRVEFRDTDAAGIMHFSMFFICMEQAEHNFLRELGMSVMLPQDDGFLSWPRVSAQCDYLAPARFEELLNIDVVVESIGNKSVQYCFHFSREQTEIAVGSLVTVCSLVRAGHLPESVPIPTDVKNRLLPYITEAGEI